MSKFAYTLMASFGAAASAQADVPVYRDNALALSETLVITDNGPAYYRNIVLNAKPDGSLDLVAAERRKLVHVTTASVVLFEPAPLQASVKVRGNMTLICVALEAPLVTRVGSTFVIALAETPYDADVRCINPATDYQVSIPLDLSGLKAGTYSVVVNGVETTFTLPADN